MTSPNTKKDLFYWHVLVYFLLTFGIGLLPPLGITQFGMRVTGVFLGLIYGWTFLGFVWPSLFSMIALGFTGYDTPANIITAGLGHPTVLFTIFVFIFVDYCSRSGLNDTLAKWLISQKWLLGRPWLFALTIFLGTFFISIAVGAVAAVFIIAGILYATFGEVGYQKGDQFPAFIMAGVYISGVLSFACQPWMGQILLGIMTLNQVSGNTCTISYLTIMAIGFPLAISTLAIYTLAIRLCFRPDAKPMLRLTPTYLQEVRKTIHIDTQQKVAAGALIVFILLMLIPGILPNETIAASFFAKFSLASGVVIILAVLSIIRIDKQPVLDFVQCAKNGVAWPVVIMLAAALPTSSALDAEGTGVSEFLTSLLTGFVNGNQLFIFLIIFIIICTIATQFTHNVTIVLVGIPILWNICSVTGLNPVGSCVLLFMASSIAFATPAASTVGALSFANTEWIGMKRAFQAGITATIIALLVLLFLGLPLVTITIGI